MPLLRALTTKIKTAISPSTSPTTSPASSPTSGFEVISGRREGGASLKRPETNERMDSFMSDQTHNASQESMEWAQRKQKRASRFREELDGVKFE